MALDRQQIIKKIYDASSEALDTEDCGMATMPQDDVYNSELQIWKRIFNSATDKIRLVCV